MSPRRRPLRRGNFTTITLTLSRDAIVWLKEKARDEMRSPANFGGKIIERFSQGLYVPSPKTRFKKNPTYAGRKNVFGIPLSDKAFAWLERTARKESYRRATFATKLIEGVSRHRYVLAEKKGGKK